MLGDGTRDDVLGGDILGGDVLGNGDIIGDGLRGDVLGGGSSVFEVIPTSGGGKYLSKRV